MIMSIFLFNSKHQNQDGLRAGSYMTEVFTHIWFSKWISLSLHYWLDSQHNVCLPWRWLRGGLIPPQFPKWVHLKHSPCCFRCRDSAMTVGATCMRECMYVCKYAKDQINLIRMRVDWAVPGASQGSSLFGKDGDIHRFTSVLQHKRCQWDDD